MQSFLNRLAKEVVQNHPNNLGEVAIILPNRRSHLFLQQEFANLITKNTWAPQLFSLEDFISSLTRLQVIDPIDLVFELYQVHKKMEGSSAEPLEEFINWGGVLLQDFNEIDRHLVDATELYGFLSEAKAIDTWNPDQKELSPFQLNYLHFWSKLKDYYQLFKKHLISKDLAYQGLNFRTAAENIGNLSKSNFDRIYFAGFNAFTKAEQTLVDHFVTEEQAVLIFDADDYYLNNKNQEAGYFLRKHIKTNSAKWIGQNFKAGKKKIKLYGLAGNIAQAKAVGTLLEQDTEKNTALVLADEALLIPILDSLPEAVDQVNITMGYPLVNASLFDFFHKYLELYQEPFFENGHFSGKKVFQFLSHPVWQNTSKAIRAEIEQVNQSLSQDIWSKVPASSLSELNSLLNISIFYAKTPESTALIDSCLQLIDGPFVSQSNQEKLNREVQHQFYNSLNRIQSILKQQPASISLKGLLQLYAQVLSSETVSFIGEPLSGLQIMGVLESRALDFDRVIVSSMNEGVLPAGKSQNSFIPYDIKRKFDLPSYKEKDAIFAYHFYRLIQCAEEINLFYNTSKDGIGNAEKSRFILQLEQELSTYNPNITIENQLISVPSKRETIPIVEISADKVNENLLKRFKSGLSASAINTRVNCPLDYYYKYILKLEEKKEQQVELAPYEFGSIIHLALEIIYSDFKMKVLDLMAIKQMKAQQIVALDQAFIEVLDKVPKSGYQKIAYEVAKRYLDRVIRMDEAEIQKGNELIIIDLEQTFSKEIDLEAPVKKLTLKGTIDRIDSKNGSIRIIDYKTGGVKQQDITITALQDTFRRSKKDKALQLLIYQIAVAEQHPNASAGIVSMRGETCHFMPLIHKNEGEESSETAYKNYLSDLLDFLLIKEDSLSHNTKSDYCNFC